MNMIFLKYATAGGDAKAVSRFLEKARMSRVYEPANLLILQDNARNMRRTMDLIAIFDSDQFAGQRVRLF